VDENSESEIKLLLSGVIPERGSEMSEYLNKYAPYFTRCDDRPGFTVDSGAFGILRFTTRTMHIMWILGFAANQALYSFSGIIALLRIYNGKLDSEKLDEIPGQLYEEGKYRMLIESVYDLAKINDPKSFSWPSSVPIPRTQKPTDLDGATTFDLICMSGAYIFLHEMKHIAFSEDGNAPSSLIEEESLCDQFAMNMMLDELRAYSIKSGYDLARLQSKRAMSISLALFFMLVITPPSFWSGSDTHPSITNRINSLFDKLSIPDDDILWLYMSSLFLSHLRYLKKESFTIKFSVLKELTINLISIIENVTKDNSLIPKSTT
jgi:hypothetical protein